MAAGVLSGVTAAHASSQHVDAKVLVIGQPGGDPTTEAWQAQLTSEGVPYTLVLADGAAGNQTVILPDLVDPGDADHGLFDGVVITASRYYFAWPQLLPVWTYEGTFGVRQIDGYVFPDSALGLDFVEGGDLSGTTANLTAAGLATFPTLTGPVPFDIGTFGYVSTAGASMTPLLEDSSGLVLMGIYQHPDPDWSTLQHGVAELAITFDYNSNSSHWLMLAPGLIDWVTNGAFAPHPQTLDLKVLLIGQPGDDPTTQAWQAQLTSEGVPYTLVLASGSPGSLTVSLPPLVDPGDANHGLFDGVVITTTRFAFVFGQLSPVWDYESTFGVRQVDGYVFPGSFVGLNPVSSGDLSNTTSTLIADGLATFPALKGPVPFDTGTFGYGSTVDPSPPAGASTTPLLEDSSGNIQMAIYQHAAVDDPWLQPGVAELAITFDYGPTFLQWLILAPGLIDWVTNGAHLGLFRNYFGQEVDDVLLPDNSWSSTYHCTPGATNPPDITCPPGVDIPPDQQMNAADVDHVVQWEHQTGITLELAFNGVGGTDHPAFASALLAKQADFNWVNHTWSHQFLGCTAFQAMPVPTLVVNASGGSLEAGTDTYEVTAVTAYGESEPSAPQEAIVDDGDSVSLTWPDAPNGGGPLLWQLEAQFGGGSGSWGYKIYRQLGDGTYGLVGSVPEDTSGVTTSYSFTDTGTTPPGAGPSSTSAYPTATNPAILCDTWDPASAIQAEFDQNIAFALAHGLSHFDPSVVVTGEHSGVENPYFSTAMSASGITTFRTDASRQPNQYSLVGPTSTALSAPSYPSNIYYNAANWADEIDEYNTLYLDGAPNGHCVNTPTNTCITTPATETSILASESRIELRHILGNDPRVGFAHQMNLIGPASSGYTLLTFLDDVLAQYHAWFKVPLQQMTVLTEAQVLSRQSGWQAALAAGDVVASRSGDTITVTNNNLADPVTVPVSAPVGWVVDGISLGERYGASVSSWQTLQPGTSLIVTAGSGPTITSAASTTFTIGQAGSFTVTTSGTPAPSLAESGALPAGVTFTDNGDGTATIAGTPAGAGATYPLDLSADNGVGSAVHQSFSLSVNVTPHVVWRKLKAIVFGTPLSPVQLNATASVSGTFVYNPASGAVLPVGTNTLTATFTPTDTVTYATTTVHNSLKVKKAASSTSVVFVSPIAVGHEELAHFVVTVVSSNGVIPSGTVTIKAGKSTACTASLDGFGVAACTLSPSKLKAGSYTVTAKYSGSASFDGSKSAGATLIVTP